VELALDSPWVVDCIGNLICEWKFPSAPVQTTIGRYPFVFQLGPPPKPAPGSPTAN